MAKILAPASAMFSPPKPRTTAMRVMTSENAARRNMVNFTFKRVGLRRRNTGKARVSRLNGEGFWPSLGDWLDRGSTGCVEVDP